MKSHAAAIKDLITEDTTKLMLLISMIMLTFEFYGWQGPFHQMSKSWSFTASLGRNDRYFYAQLWTTSNFLILFVLVPWLFHLLFKKENIHNYGLNWNANRESWLSYGILAAIMIPIVFVASMSPNFYRFYPLYRPLNGGDWFLFELVYLVQFFCVEYFFRGFALFRLHSSIGNSAIGIMVLPYALIHIHKPFPEAIGSIFAGLILGYLALKGRSIWPGVFLHMLIALAADSFGLYFSGWFF